jgi:nicotinate-nucleotide adenylyltransferase
MEGDRKQYYIGQVLSHQKSSRRTLDSGKPLLNCRDVARKFLQAVAELATRPSPRTLGGVADLSAAERIGLFGGTFDPPHLGHLVTAVNVRHALRLDRVVLMVAGEPWQKTGTRQITPAAARLAMVQAAVEGVPGLEAGDLEVRRGGASYTADTLEALHEQYPGALLYTIVGDDAAAGFPTWQRFERVAELSTLVVVDRPGFVADLPDRFSWVHVEVPHLEVSSTDLRARVSDGRPLDYLVTDAVRTVIGELGLYRSEGAVTA